MAEPLWRSYDSNKCLSRRELEMIIQKRKVTEVLQWFQEHFQTSETVDYIKRCPIVIIQGPSGCGKTTTLKYVAHELNVPIKEYSETTDVTAINLDIAKSNRDDESYATSNTSQTINRRKALKFEHYVLNSLRYNTLYPADDPPADADSDCDFDDSFAVFTKPNISPAITGVIIHVDTPLTFAKCQRTLIKTLQNLIKTIQGLSRHMKRRIAIVFETLEGDNEIIQIPMRVKQILGIHTIKFNPIVRTNLKKFIESISKQYTHIVFDDVTIDRLINDCDGDLRACINTLQVICAKSNSTNALSRIDSNTKLTHHAPDVLSPLYQTAIKRQKTYHDRAVNAGNALISNLMRDDTKGTGFFHALGKIFYQKRLYPDIDQRYLNIKKAYRSIDRPYSRENSTEYLASMIDASPKNLITWLHHHYHRYCGETNIEKAALFLDNMSTTDATSISSLQSSQFFEAHNTLDQIQTCLAIESTTYSLYENRMDLTAPSQKKISGERGQKFVVKLSVENTKQGSKNGSFVSYNKPSSLNLPRVIEDYRELLAHCTAKLFEVNQRCIDSHKVLIDYASYISHLSDNWQATLVEDRRSTSDHPIYDDQTWDACFKTMQKMENELEDIDLEGRHEKLQELIDGLL